MGPKGLDSLYPPLLVRKSYLFSTKNGTFYFPSNSSY